VGLAVEEQEEEEEEKWEARADKREAATVLLGGVATVGRLEARTRRGATAEEGAVQARAGVSLCSCLGASVLCMKTVAGADGACMYFCDDATAWHSEPGPEGRGKLRVSNRVQCSLSKCGAYSSAGQLPLSLTLFLPARVFFSLSPSQRLSRQQTVHGRRLVQLSMVMTKKVPR
jgi:hypothetical protein